MGADPQFTTVVSVACRRCFRGWEGSLEDRCRRCGEKPVRTGYYYSLELRPSSDGH
jgi:hypothetical protein